MPGIADVPEGIEPARWVGTPYTPPTIGDLWLLSWDGSALGLGLVSGVAASFALVWPVSLLSDEAFPPAVEVPQSPLGVPLAVWPTRETGVGLHLFDRRFGQLLSERAMAVTLDAVEAGEDPPLAWVRSELNDAERESASDSMIDRWEAICLHTWPTAQLGSSPLSAEILERAGVGIAQLVSVLDIETQDAVALYRGELAPTVEQVVAIAAAFGFDPNDLMEAGSDAGFLLSPEYKAEFVETARRLGIGEGQARDRVRSEVALAARSDGDPVRLIAAAIQRVRQRDQT